MPQLATHLNGTMPERLRFQDIKRREARTHRQTVLAEGGGMHDSASQRGVNAFIDRVGHQRSADWHQSAALCLRQHNNIWLDSVMMGREEPSGSKHSRLNLV